MYSNSHLKSRETIPFKKQQMKNLYEKYFWKFCGYIERFIVYICHKSRNYRFDFFNKLSFVEQTVASMCLLCKLLCRNCCTISLCTQYVQTKTPCTNFGLDFFQSSYESTVCKNWHSILQRGERTHS